MAARPVLRTLNRQMRRPIVQRQTEHEARRDRLMVQQKGSVLPTCHIRFRSSTRVSRTAAVIFIHIYSGEHTQPFATIATFLGIFEANNAAQFYLIHHEYGHVLG